MERMDIYKMMSAWKNKRHVEGVESICRSLVAVVQAIIDETYDEAYESGRAAGFEEGVANITDHHTYPVR